MAITRISQNGPTNTASGNVGLNWSTIPTSGNLLILNIFSLSGQTMPATISGWSTIFTNGIGGGYVSAQYIKTATGTETGTFSIVTATMPTIAWVNEYHTDQNGKNIGVSGSYGGDSDDSATGIVTSSLASLNSTAGDWLESGTVWASTSPSFPTLPGTGSARTITQNGASLGTIQNRASTTWQTNHRYNLSDIAVTNGATAAIKYVSNTTTASLQGLTNFAVLHEVTGNTAPTSSASVPSSALPSATYTVTDTSTVTTAGAAITSRVWRIVSGGGSLSSTTASSSTVTAPSTTGTQIIGIIATDSNGLSGSEATYSVTIAAGLSANAGIDQTVDASIAVNLAGSGTGTAWLWRQISGTSVTLSSTTIQNPTFTSPATVAGDTLVFGLKRGDGVGGYSTEDTVTITVQPQTEWKLMSGAWKGMTSAQIV
jgi:hypothetical protein